MTSELKPDLRYFGYKKGDYICKCKACDRQFLGAKNSWRCTNCAVAKSEETAVIRAVPVVPELVRYGVRWGQFGEYPHGEYVRYDQAAAVVAAEQMKLEATAKAGLKLSEELESVKAELTQIKAQEPVGSYEIENGEVISTTDFGDGKLPYPDGDLLLYAAPVDQTAEIERLREKYREAVRNAFKDPNAALSGKEPT